MLLIHPESEHHIKQRLLERSQQEVTIRWFYNLIKFINDYLPDDWRLGLRSNEFLIRTIGENSVTIVGETYKSKSNNDKFIHLIKTVLPIGGFAKGERSEDVQDNNKEKAQRPNLYVIEFLEENRINNFIKKKWFYPISPIAARQYEKINPNQTGDFYEYHRVHPLTKNGISLSTFGWIRWYQDGKVDYGTNVFPELDWRGENYWKINKTIDKRDEKDMITHYLSVTQSNR